MSEKQLNKLLVALIILILLGGGAFALYLIQTNNTSTINEAAVNDCSEMNGWWDTGYHEFTITAPVVKSWNGNEGVIEKDPSEEGLYKITFEAEKDGYVRYLIYYIKKAQPGSKTEYILQDVQQGSGWFDLYKKNDN